MKLQYLFFTIYLTIVSSLSAQNSDNSDFGKFVNSLKYRVLPFEVFYGDVNQNFEDIEKFKIPRSILLKNFLGGDAKKLKNSSGGNYHYYGLYRFNKFNDFTPILYCRDDEFQEYYFLALFDSKGIKISELLVTGQDTYSFQCLSKIDRDFNINKKEINYKFSNNVDIYPGYEIVKNYKLDKLGKFSFIGKTDSLNGRYRLDEDSFGRFVKVK